MCVFLRSGYSPPSGSGANRDGRSTRDRGSTAGVLLAAVLAAMLVTGGCGTAGTPSRHAGPSTTPPAATPGAPSPTSASPTRSPTAPGPATTRTAAGDLLPFTRAARRVDALLHAAAQEINRGVGTTEIRIDQAVNRAVREADPGLSATEIPPGLNRDLLRATLLVQADLVVRRAAFNNFSGGTGVYPRDQEPAARMMTCLANGAAAAARFDADLAALESLAARSVPVRVAAPDSQAAADLAVRLHEIALTHNGCGGCGRPLNPELAQVTWSRVPVHGSRGEGTVWTIPFQATYTPSGGWDVLIFAC